MTDLIACPSCDLIQRRVVLRRRGRAFCGRCGALLYRFVRSPVDKPLACALASLMLFLGATLFPFMSFELAGRTQHTTLASSAVALWSDGHPFLSALVLLTTILAPLVLLSGLLYLLVPLRMGFRLPGSRSLCRWIAHIKPWAMLEVFLLAVLVAGIKLASDAEVTYGSGCVAFGALIVTLSMTLVSWDREVFWSRVPCSLSEHLWAPPR